jgi:hypothetical protein
MAKFSRAIDRIPATEADKIVKTLKRVETPEGPIFVEVEDGR